MAAATATTATSTTMCWQQQQRQQQHSQLATARVYNKKLEKRTLPVFVIDSTSFCYELVAKATATKYSVGSSNSNLLSAAAIATM